MGVTAKQHPLWISQLKKGSPLTEHLPLVLNNFVTSADATKLIYKQYSLFFKMMKFMLIIIQR